jgi:hypothetical protein
MRSADDPAVVIFDVYPLIGPGIDDRDVVEVVTGTSGYPAVLLCDIEPGAHAAAAARIFDEDIGPEEVQLAVSPARGGLAAALCCVVELLCDVILIDRVPAEGLVAADFTGNIEFELIVVPAEDLSSRLVCRRLVSPRTCIRLVGS